MSNMNTEPNIELRSEEVQEILGRPPRWIVRVGTTVIFAVVVGLFVGSYFFKYPDILSATITVTTENLPAEVTAKTSGKIDTIFVSEKQHLFYGAPASVKHPKQARPKAYATRMRAPREVRKMNVNIKNLNTMKNLKLNKLSSQRLAEKDMKNICGGLAQYMRYFPEVGFITVCTCACRYANSGGSSTENNGDANYKNGIIPEYTKSEIVGPYLH